MNDKARLETNMRRNFPLPFLLTCLIGVVPVMGFVVMGIFASQKESVGFEGLGKSIIQVVNFIIFFFFTLLSGGVYYKNRFALVTALITLPMWLGIVAVVIASAISLQSGLQRIVLGGMLCLQVLVIVIFIRELRKKR